MDELDKLEVDIDNARGEEFEFGDNIRRIPVEIYANVNGIYEANANIIQDTNTELLVVAVTDVKEGDIYTISFNSKWMTKENQDWLAQVLANNLYDNIKRCKENYKNRILRTLRAFKDLVGGVI